MKRWIWNLWFEHWYLPRHPYHTVSPTLSYWWRRIQKDLWSAVRLQSEEYNWIEEEIT